MRKVLYIFGLLTDADVAWIGRAAIRRRLNPGEVIIQEGSYNDFIIILLDGVLQISTSQTGDVTKARAGEILGEVSLVDSAPPSATVRAEGECVALFLNKEVLLQKIEADIGFGCRFYRAVAVVLADRLRTTLRLPSYNEHGLGGEGTVLQDELDPPILDTTSAAGEQFNRMLKIIMESDSSGNSETGALSTNQKQP
jgi:CRP/FNR family cyclic AMP-dependent transcriptional regulator